MEHKLILDQIYSTNLVIILFMMQVSKKIPFDDPNVLNAVRATYLISNLVIIGIYYYVQMQINKKKGTLITWKCTMQSSPSNH